MRNVPSHQENLTLLAHYEDRKGATANSGGDSLAWNVPETSNHKRSLLHLDCGSPCGIGHDLCPSSQASS
jgi:hypothetical protein